MISIKNLKDRIYRLKNSAYKIEPTGDKKRLVSQNEIENSGLIEFCFYLKNEKKDRFTKINFSYNNGIMSGHYNIKEMKKNW